MRKTTILFLVIILIFGVSSPVCAASDKSTVNTKSFEKLLQSNYGVLSTSVGDTDVSFAVSRESDIYEIQIDIDYELFNDVQFGYYMLSEKKKATTEIMDYVESVYKEAVKRYPKVKWCGYFNSTYTNIYNDEASRRFFSWSNYKDNKLLTEIQWLPYQDAGWDLGIWDELEK